VDHAKGFDVGNRRMSSTPIVRCTKRRPLRRETLTRVTRLPGAEKVADLLAVRRACGSSGRLASRSAERRH
jgi:hypothetical protein